MQNWFLYHPGVFGAKASGGGHRVLEDDEMADENHSSEEKPVAEGHDVTKRLEAISAETGISVAHLRKIRSGTSKMAPPRHVSVEGLNLEDMLSEVDDHEEWVAPSSSRYNLRGSTSVLVGLVVLSIDLVSEILKFHSDGSDATPNV